MRHLFLTLTMLIALTPSTLHAQEIQKTPETILVTVQGMVCDFCAQSIFKVFQRQVSLEKEQIDINLDTQIITIAPSPEQEITDDQIKEFIHYAGYDLVDIERMH